MRLSHPFSSVCVDYLCLLSRRINDLVLAPSAETTRLLILHKIDWILAFEKSTKALSFNLV